MNWREKYRPRNIEELAGCADFKSASTQWDIDTCPTNILFVGPPGTGKTSAAGALTRALMGEFFDPCNYIITNASDDRGIDYVRQLKGFTRQKALGVSKKVYLLDEADNLTSAAQKALRQVMEDSHRSAIFILVANDIGPLHAAIRDRCVTFYFKAVSDEDAYNRLSYIAKEENLPDAWAEQYSMLNRLTSGSLRQSIDILQALPHDDSALMNHIRRDGNTLGKAALNLMGSQFPQVTALLVKSLENGNNRLGVMKGLRYRAKTLMENEDDWHNFMLTYGEFVILATQWPDDDLAFVEYFVAKLRKNMEK